MNSKSKQDLLLTKKFRFVDGCDDKSKDVLTKQRLWCHYPLSTKWIKIEVLDVKRQFLCLDREAEAKPETEMAKVTLLVVAILVRS